MKGVLSSALFEHDEEWLRRCPALMGIDEAGRGPLAGPVVAAAVLVKREAWLNGDLQECVQACDDSKKLKEAQRELIFSQMEGLRERGLLAVACHAASVEEIEVHNILGATQVAMNRAIDELWQEPQYSAQDCYLGEAEQLSLITPRLAILVDGLPMKKLVAPHVALVKGDGRSAVIALASIVAKVTRDRLMRQIDGEFPQYGFARHKGYGTRKHYAALGEHGLCPAHRPSFLKKYNSVQVQS